MRFHTASTHTGIRAPCIGCEHFAEYRAGGSIVLCMYGGRAQVNAQPEQGCVHWVRGIGSDDEKKKAKRRA